MTTYSMISAAVSSTVSRLDAELGSGDLTIPSINPTRSVQRHERSLVVISSINASPMRMENATNCITPFRSTIDLGFKTTYVDTIMNNSLLLARVGRECKRAVLSM